MSILELFEFTLKFNLAAPDTADLKLNLASSDCVGKLFLRGNFITTQP